jgi:hypothetical protein
MPAEPPDETARAVACLGALLGGNVCPILALRKVLSQRHAGGAASHARDGASHGAQAGQQQEGAGEQGGGKLQSHACAEGQRRHFAVQFAAQCMKWQRLQRWFCKKAACHCHHTRHPQQSTALRCYRCCTCVVCDVSKQTPLLGVAVEAAALGGGKEDASQHASEVL